MSSDVVNFANIAMNDELTQEFIRKNKKNLDKKDATCNKLSLNVCIHVNDYVENYTDFMKVGNVVYTFLIRFHDERDRLPILWLNILRSVKKQLNFICYLKRICKKTCITKQDYKMLLDSIDRANRRFDYLYNRVLPEYMDITPLYSYKKVLESKGISFVDDIKQNINFEVDKEEFYFGHKEVDDYCDRIIAACDQEDTTWKDNLASYMAKSEKRLEYIKEEKKKEREDNRRKKSETAQRLLNTYSEEIRREYQKAYLSSDRRGAGSLVPRVVKFSERGEKCKIVVMLSTYASSKSSMKFYSKDKEDHMCGGARNCSILQEHEELSQDILDKINDYRMVICEIVLN